MSKASAVSIRNSIATKLLTVVFSIYVVITVALTGMHMAVEYIGAQESVIRDLGAMEETFSQGLATAIYNVDNEQVRSMVQGMVESPTVVGVRVITEYQGGFEAGQTLIDGTRDSGASFERSSGEAEGVFWLTQPIIYAEEMGRGFAIGALTLYSSRLIVLSKVWRSFSIILVNSVIKTMALWVIFLVASRKLLLRPLSELALGVSRVDPENLDGLRVDARTRGPNELKVLEDAFNRMLDKLRSSHRRSSKLLGILEDARGELEQHSLALEEKVAERTAELHQKNRELTEALVAAREARAAAEAAVRSRSEFLATMSHEIRTPMNAIMGAAELLQGSHPNERQREYLRVFRSSGELLRNIIDEILDFSKLEAGGVELEHVSFDLPELLRETMAVVEPQAANKGVALSLSLAESAPKRVAGDPARLKQALLNLLGNAVKFTEAGSVDVLAARDSAASDMVRFDVRDTGVGISSDKLEHIFESFTQADSSTTRRYGGTGLGLAIARRLTTMMGGSIHVESEPGKGTLFSIRARLPEAAPVAVSTETQSGAARQGDGGSSERAELPTLRLLIVEDSPTNRTLLQLFLESTPLTLSFAENGLEAVELFQSNIFDAVLMDIQMPVMDGYEATRAIRAFEAEQGQDRAKAWIIALTANAFEEDERRCRDAGCDDYLSKPVGRAQIIQALARGSVRG